MSLITITGAIGCGEVPIARHVADALKLDLYTDHRLQEEASKIGIPPDALENMDEKAPGLFSRLLSRKPDIYLDLIGSVIYEVARRGEGVVLGHGAQLLLRDFGCGLHVRIDASELFRIQYLMDQHWLSREASEKIIHKSDSERKGFLQFAFHMDWSDPSLYDLIINRDKLTIESASNLIVEVAQSQEIKECSLTALDSMERLSLLKKIDAALLKHDISTADFHVEVPEKGVAQVTGITYSEETKDRLLVLIKKVPGVSDVRSEVNVVPLSGF